MEPNSLKRPVFDNHLPPAACTSELLNELNAFAAGKQTSMSSVIRHAVSVFLANENSKSSQNLDKQVEAAQS